MVALAEGVLAEGVEDDAGETACDGSPSVAVGDGEGEATFDAAGGVGTPGEGLMDGLVVAWHPIATIRTATTTAGRRLGVTWVSFAALACVFTDEGLTDADGVRL